MQQFIEKYREQIQGVVSGFDRLVFRGSLGRLNQGYWDEARRVFVAHGMEQYCWQNQILFKDYQQHVKGVSERLKKKSLQPFGEQDRPVIFLRDPKVDKEQLARRIAAEKGLTSGLVCALSALEPSPTFDHLGCNLIRRIRPCHVLYHYQIHPQMGWMHARIQTWFPFHIQIAINGREWLARQMDQEGMRYRKQDNCFVWIEDYERAQALLQRQLESSWTEILGGFARQLNPLQERIFERYPASYYWTCYQSEWATDIVFHDAGFLRRLMPLLVRHAVLSFSCADVMRYLGKKLNKDGSIPERFGGTVQADEKRRREGERIKYRLNGNAAKFYDKAYSDRGAVLRGAETTINRVTDFRVFRPKQGGPETELAWRPMRLGIADLHRRAQVSQHCNERVLDALAAVDDSRRVEELTAAVQTPVWWEGRRVRALRPWGDDKDLLSAVIRGEFAINGFRNRDLQQLLHSNPAETVAERRRRSAAMSRKLRLLRAHGLIHRVSRTHRYQVTASGRAILIAVLTTAQISTHEINQLIEQRKAA